MSPPSNQNSTVINEIIEDLLKIRHPDFARLSQSTLTSHRKSIREEVSQLYHNQTFSLNELNAKLLIELVTSRNKQLINVNEQEQLQKVVVSFFGLSVGSHAATAWTMIARPQQVKICDPDILSYTNLNRLPYSINEVGHLKTTLMKRKLIEISPKTTVLAYTDGDFDAQTEIVESNPKSTIIVDAIDDLAAKIHLRKLAKKNRLPLISAIDVGDSVFLDIERYDLKPTPEPFLGRLKNIENLDVQSLSPKEKRSMLIKLVGLENNSEKMLLSLLAIGNEIPTWPQLGSTAMIAGGVVATAIKNIALGTNTRSGRTIIGIDSLLDSTYHDIEKKSVRNKLRSLIMGHLE